MGKAPAPARRRRESEDDPSQGMLFPITGAGNPPPAIKAAGMAPTVAGPEFQTRRDREAFPAFRSRRNLG